MIYPICGIVAGIATLDEPDPVLGPVVELANRTGAMLHLVHAFELPDLVWDAYARMGYMDGAAMRQYTEGVQARLEAQARRLTPSDRLRCHAVAGSSAPAIQELALREQADLIVVGATRHGTLARTILGTTAQRVLRGAPAPVLMLRGALPPRIRRVLLTTDLTPFSAGIHEVGRDVIDTLFAPDHPELRSLLVVWYGSELPPPLRQELVQEFAHRELREFLGQRRPRTGAVEGVVRCGDPAKEIVAEATDWKADLIVVGTHGRSAPRRWVLGSVAEAAMRGALGHVLVIPARMEEQRALPVPLVPEPVSGPWHP